MLDFDFFEQFCDEYLQDSEGQGVFLAGIALGMLARGQVEKGQSIDKSPLFKQLNFGKIQLRDLKRHLAKVPDITRAYRVQAPGRLEQLAAQAGTLMLQSGIRDLGVNGNFSFSTAFLNPWPYYSAIFHISPAANTETEEAQPDDEEESDIEI